MSLRSKALTLVLALSVFVADFASAQQMMRNASATSSGLRCMTAINGDPTGSFSLPMTPIKVNGVFSGFQVAWKWSCLSVNGGTLGCVICRTFMIEHYVPATSTRPGYWVVLRVGGYLPPYGIFTTAFNNACSTIDIRSDVVDTIGGDWTLPAGLYRVTYQVFIGPCPGTPLGRPGGDKRTFVWTATV